MTTNENQSLQDGYRQAVFNSTRRYRRQQGTSFNDAVTSDDIVGDVTLIDPCTTDDEAFTSDCDTTTNSIIGQIQLNEQSVSVCEVENKH